MYLCLWYCVYNSLNYHWWEIKQQYMTIITITVKKSINILQFSKKFIHVHVQIMIFESWQFIAYFQKLDAENKPRSQNYDKKILVHINWWRLEQIDKASHRYKCVFKIKSNSYTETQLSIKFIKFSFIS